jgi:hypothetical protein
MNMAETKDITKRRKKSLEDRFDALIALLRKHGIHHADDLQRADPAPTSEYEPDEDDPLMKSSGDGQNAGDWTQSKQDATGFPTGEKLDQGK